MAHSLGISFEKKKQKKDNYAHEKLVNFTLPQKRKKRVWM